MAKGDTVGLGLVSVSRRLEASRYSPPPSTATISTPIRMPTATLRAFFGSSGTGAMTEVGGREMTCVASPPVGSSGVA